MKALLMKDLHVFWRRMKLFIWMILIFSAIPSIFQTTFAITYAAMIPYSMFSVDEASKWERLAVMMPYSTFDLVMSKYVLGFLSIGGAVAAVLFIQPLMSFVTGETGADGGITFTAVCVSLIIMAVTLPLIFRFGVERARMTMILLVAAICGSAGAMASMTDAGVRIHFGGGLFALGAAAGIAQIVSIPLSMKLYEKRKA